MDDLNLPEGFQLDEQPVTAPVSNDPLAAQPADIDNPYAETASPVPAGFQLDEEKYGTTTEMAKTFGEGVAEGVAGPLGTFALTQSGISDPEAMLARRETNPITHGTGQATGLAGSLFLGTGMGSALGKAGTIAKEAAGLGKALEGGSLLSKIGAEAVDQAVQNALFQGGDEISKMIINDPNTTAESAIGNIGLAGALGGLTGAAVGSISPLFKSVSDDTAKFLTDFKGELKAIKDMPDPISAATKELEDLHLNTQTLKESLYSTGVKGDLIKAHLPEMTPANTAKLQSQVEGIYSKLRTAAEQAADSVDTKNAVPYIEQRLKDFEASLLKADSYEAGYNAINDLKKALQADAKKGRAYGVDLNTSALGEISGKLASEIKPLLEDVTAWGKAGKVQKVFNEAFSEFTNSKAEKDFIKTFTHEVGGERQLDPAKIDLFIRQSGSPKAEIKNEILENYLKEHSAFAKKVNDMAIEAGVDPLVAHPELNTLNKLMNVKTSGQQAAQMLVGKLKDEGLGEGMAAGLGGTIGGFPGAIAGQYLLGKTFTKIMNGLSQAILDNPVSSNGMSSAIDLTIAAIKGQTVLNKAASAVFKGGVPVLSSNHWPDESDREKLDKVVSKVKSDPEALTKVDTGSMNHYMPNAQAAYSGATARAIGYLSSIKPEPFRSSPLDREIQPSDAEKQRYNRALDIAQEPNVILQHVKDGTLQASDLQDLDSMYPSLYTQMRSKLSNEIANMQAAEINIPYKTRMGLSLFLGQALDTSMQPTSIQAAQPQPPPQNGPQGKPQGASKNTAKLGKETIQNAQTPLQAATQHKAERT